MKRNVDLTLNQDFLEKPDHEQQLEKPDHGRQFEVFQDMMQDYTRNTEKRIFPWNPDFVYFRKNHILPQIDNLSNQKYSLIAIGTKEERSIAKEYRSLDNMEICYRCGAPIEPYMKFRPDKLLCKRCYNDCENYDIDKVPWFRYKTERRV